MDTISHHEFVDTLQALPEAPGRLVRDILSNAILRPFSAGMLIYAEGDTCILNASCILSHTTYPANAVSTKGGSMLLLPADDFRGLMETSMEMRHFVFEIMSRRLTAVRALVEEVAFGRMDIRLKEYLLEKAEYGVLKSTHQKIADDLGTSREVMSRLLKDLERKGLLALSRNEITIFMP
ncbi:MAG: Crp/Fnr family transcriptional regulator [Dissulfurispiraceae bacterium]